MEPTTENATGTETPAWPANLEELRQRVLADGIIDYNEVQEIRTAVLDDEVVDRAEAEFLFALNDAVTGKANSAAWPLFFANALTAHVLHDETSPGVIDADEAQWILDKVQGDGQVDDAEKALLANIRVHATDIHSILAGQFEALGIN